MSSLVGNGSFHKEWRGISEPTSSVPKCLTGSGRQAPDVAGTGAEVDRARCRRWPKGALLKPPAHPVLTTHSSVGTERGAAEHGTGSTLLVMAFY
jgi:hypothetical protein